MPELRPDARDRLARHLWITAARDPEAWDRFDEAAARLEALNAEHGWSLRLEGADDRKAFLARADELLAVITGKGSER